MASYVSFRKKYEPRPDARQIMHHHSGCEIVLFVSGNVRAVTYENTYPVEPYDVFLFAEREMHGMFPECDTPYLRYVLYLESSFFKEMNCEHYLMPFTERKYGTENRITAKQAEKCGIHDAIKKIEGYSHLFMTPYDAVARAAVVELLHLISCARSEIKDSTPETNCRNGMITDVIEYINEHVKEKISLDELSEKFHFSKNYLCRVFKQATGYSVIEYVNRKRIDMARAMHREGYSLYDAAIEVGFGSYSSFYRTFIKEFGRTPREDSMR